MIEIELSYCTIIKRKRKKSLKCVKTAEIDKLQGCLDDFFILIEASSRCLLLHKDDDRA